jgi:hypothetical protein
MSGEVFLAMVTAGTTALFTVLFILWLWTHGFITI